MTTAGTFSPTPQQTQNALGPVFYEIEQLIFSATIPPNLMDNLCFDNMKLESTLIHVRNLIPFFETAQRKHDDILCTDFGFSAQPINVDQAVRTRLNKDLAHLTYARVGRTVEEKLWKYQEILLPILTRTRKFLEHLLSNYISQNSQQYTRCEKLLQYIVESLTVI